MPRWTVAGSPGASSSASVSRASAQRPIATPSCGSSGTTARGSPIDSPPRASLVVDRSTTGVESQSPARSGAVSSFTCGRSIGGSPATSRSASVASANGTAATTSSAAHSSSRDAWTYSLSGSSAPCWSPLIATDAARATTSGHTAASSGSVSGSRCTNPRAISRAACSGRSRSWTTSAAIVTARSAASHVRDRSPKSMSPTGIGRAARSGRVTVLRSVTSWWTTPTRRPGASASTDAHARAMDSPSSARRTGVEANGPSASHTAAA